MKEKKTKIAVSAFVIKDGKFLLLKRNNPPKEWGPPAGRVQEGEILADAVKRETKEEANIDIKILVPINLWSGKHEGEMLFSIGILCEYVSGEIRSSKEHSEARWFSIKELKNEKITHDIKDFIRAEKIKALFDSDRIE